MSPDEQEARSRKYGETVRVFRLSSGRIAAFGYYRYGSGFEFIGAFDDWLQAGSSINQYLLEAKPDKPTTQLEAVLNLLERI